MSLAFASVGYAQGTASSPETGTLKTQAQVKELKRSAHAPEQFKVLASYYGQRNKSYIQQAAEEKKEWERRGKNVTGSLAKYPRPVDSARNLYEYYMAKASQAGALEAKYSRMASPDAPVNAQ
jgi:CRISPR/Cas system-associated endonuclease/helicase Cas3